MKALSDRDLVRDARLPLNDVFSTTGTRPFDRMEKKWGAILYYHQGAENPTEAVETRTLRDVIYSSGYSSNEACDVVGEALKQLENAHAARQRREMPVREHFDRYFREHASEKRIRCILGNDGTREEFDFLGVRVMNPLACLQRLPEREELCVGAIHGDLHPDNIVLDRRRAAHLIDFAWAGDGEVLVDFVLLETSIRFNLFPKRMNLDEQALVDQALLDEDGADTVLSLPYATDESRQLYARLAQTVDTIRGRAMGQLRTDFSMERYLLTQFILLYGLLRYPEYEPYSSTRALGMIAKRLRDRGVLSDG